MAGEAREVAEDGVVFRRGQARRAAGDEAQAVVERAQQFVARAERLELFRAD